MVLVLEPVIDADVPKDFELVAVSVLDGVSDPLHDGDDVREDDAPDITDDMGVCDSETPLVSELVGVTDSEGGTEFDSWRVGELDLEAPVESDADDDSD